MPTLDPTGHGAGSEEETLMIGASRVGTALDGSIEMLELTGGLWMNMSLAAVDWAEAEVVLLHPAEKGDMLGSQLAYGEKKQKRLELAETTCLARRSIPRLAFPEVCAGTRTVVRVVKGNFIVRVVVGSGMTFTQVLV